MKLPWLSGRYGRGGAYAAAPAAPASGASEVTRQSDLVGWWKFDEESGTNAEDVSDTGNDGTLTNMADSDWVAGKNGNALEFDGADDVVLIPADSAYPAGDFSFSCWFKLSSGDTHRTIVASQKYYTAGKDGNWLFKVYDSSGANPRLNFASWNGTSSLLINKFESITFSEGVAPSDWHHAAFVHDDSASTIQFYFDGSTVGSTTAIAGGNDLEDASVSGLSVGAQGTTSPIREWAGLLDDIRIYNVALTDANVASIYNSGDGDW